MLPVRPDSPRAAIWLLARSPGTHFSKCTYGVLCVLFSTIRLSHAVSHAEALLSPRDPRGRHADRRVHAHARPAAQDCPLRGRAKPRLVRAPAAAVAAVDESLGPEKHGAVETANKARGDRGLGRPSAMAVVGAVAGVRESSRSARAASSLWPLACREPRVRVDRVGEENLCRAEKK